MLNDIKNIPFVGVDTKMYLWLLNFGSTFGSNNYGNIFPLQIELGAGSPVQK